MRQRNAEVIRVSKQPHAKLPVLVDYINDVRHYLEQAARTGIPMYDVPLH